MQKNRPCFAAESAITILKDSCMKNTRCKGSKNFDKCKKAVPTFQQRLHTNGCTNIEYVVAKVVKILMIQKNRPRFAARSVQFH